MNPVTHNTVPSPTPSRANHDANPVEALPPALLGTVRYRAVGGQLMAYYRSGPAIGRPLLLVHSVNAAASAAEMRPLFEHYSKTRPVYALDLPGFGLSDRVDREYTPRVMTDAVLAMLDTMADLHPGSPVDAIGVSLGCEFLARAALESGHPPASLTLVSPTGLEHGERHFGAKGTTREKRWLHRLLRLPALGQALFMQLTKPNVIRHYLKKTWGSAAIDERLHAYCCKTVRAEGARHAPLAFLSGQPFSADINKVYRRLQVPVWLAHGVHGDFTHFEGAQWLVGHNRWTLKVFDTGAMPYFEQPGAFFVAFDKFTAQPPARVKAAKELATSTA